MTTPCGVGRAQRLEPLGGQGREPRVDAVVADVEDAEELALEQRLRELRQPRERGAERRQPIRARALWARCGQRTDQRADAGLLLGRHLRLARRCRVRSRILRVFRISGSGNGSMGPSGSMGGAG